MVEAPGTAPGSNGFITMAIYRHSRCRHPQYRDRRRGMQIGKQRDAYPCEILRNRRHYSRPPARRASKWSD